MEEIIFRVLTENPKFGYVKITLHFGKNGLFVGYEFEISDAKLINKEGS
jgi:hypothetical protein